MTIHLLVPPLPLPSLILCQLCTVETTGDPSVECTVYSVQCTVYSVQCTVYSVQCTVYSVQCTLYTVHCIVNRVKSIKIIIILKIKKKNQKNSKSFNESQQISILFFCFKKLSSSSLTRSLQPTPAQNPGGKPRAGHRRSSDKILLFRFGYSVHYVQLYLHCILFTTQFEIEWRCGGHSVTKKFKTILQILRAKPKLWKKLYSYK